MAKGKSNSMDSLFGGFSAPSLSKQSEEPKVEKTEVKIDIAPKSEQTEVKLSKEEKTTKVEPKAEAKAETKPVDKPSKQEKKKDTKSYAGEERPISLRLAEEIDETYLDVTAIQKDMPKKQYLAEIMSKAVEEAKSVKPKDIDYNEPFRKDVKLKCKQVTVVLPSDLYDDINAMAKKYGMATARYIAWNVQKARLSDPDWN